MDLVLASTSPQRSAILTSLGVSFCSEAPDYDEVPIPGSPEEVVQERALGKARSVAARIAARPVLGVDTEVVVEDGEVLGQPADARDFAALGTRIAPGTALPAPSGVFPRYETPPSPPSPGEQT